MGALVIMQWSGRRTEGQTDLISIFAALVLSVLREITPMVQCSYFFLFSPEYQIFDICLKSPTCSSIC